MISVKEVALLIQNKGAIDNDRLRDIVLRHCGEVISPDRLQSIKAKIKIAVYIESEVVKIGRHTAIIVHSVNEKKYNRKAEQVAELRNYFIKNDRDKPYKYYAAKFDLTIGAVFNIYKDALSRRDVSMRGLYKPNENQSLLNSVWR